MKRIKISWVIILLFITSGLFSCNGNNQESQFSDDVTPTSTYYKPSKLLDSLTNIFLDSSACKDCVNEINIDKVPFEETYITFRATTYKE